MTMRRGGIDWSAQSLGKIPDVDIAKSLGVCRNTVNRQRRKLGIAKAPRDDRRRRIASDDAERRIDEIVRRRLSSESDSKFVLDARGDQ